MESEERDEMGEGMTGDADMDVVPLAPPFDSQEEECESSTLELEFEALLPSVSGNGYSNLGLPTEKGVPTISEDGEWNLREARLDEKEGGIGGVGGREIWSWCLGGDLVPDRDRWGGTAVDGVGGREVDGGDWLNGERVRAGVDGVEAPVDEDDEGDDEDDDDSSDESLSLSSSLESDEGRGLGVDWVSDELEDADEDKSVTCSVRVVVGVRVVSRSSATMTSFPPVVSVPV
jgi:hypothetical protein